MLSQKIADSHSLEARVATLEAEIAQTETNTICIYAEKVSLVAKGCWKF